MFKLLYGWWFFPPCFFCCPKGKYILTPCPISYAEEQLLHFFGQLLGIAIRADVPLPLDLLGSFWKGLVGEPLDPDQDLQEADVLTYNYVRKFENVRLQVKVWILVPQMGRVKVRIQPLYSSLSRKVQILKCTKVKSNICAISEARGSYLVLQKWMMWQNNLKKMLYYTSLFHKLK